jgi:nucleoside-diphosphate-sugar epimerase
VVKSAPFTFVFHTASPVHYNFQNPVKDFLEPAANRTTGLLKAVKSYAPTVKWAVFTSSFSAMMNTDKHGKASMLLREASTARTNSGTDLCRESSLGLSTSWRRKSLDLI